MSSLNYSEFCRLCLVKERVSTPIFEGEGDVRRIFLKIATCLPIKVSREDHLPKSICDDCLYKVENQYQFWNTTANSEKQLHQWLGSTVGDSIDVKNINASGMDPMEMKQESMDMDQGSELSKSLSRVEAVLAEEAGRVAAAAHGEDEDEEEEESEEEGSNSEESEDDDNDADEPNKEDDDEDEAYDEELEPTTFVNVSLACDEAGPSGTQQQTSVAPSTSTSAPAASGSPFQLYLGEQYIVAAPFEERNISNASEKKCEVLGAVYVNCNVEQEGQRTTRGQMKKRLVTTPPAAVGTADRPAKSIKRKKAFITSVQAKALPKQIPEKKQVYKSLAPTQLVCTFQGCSRTYTSPYLYDSHVKTHIPKQHPCDICQKVFTKLSVLKRHMLTHTTDRPYSCGVCNKSFKTIFTYDYHRKVAHTDAHKKYSCDSCGYATVSEHNLKIHKKRHTGETDFVCEICGKGAYTKAELESHKATHTNEKHNCEICGKDYASKRYLFLHQEIHNPKRVKPFQCELCGKSFRYRNKLRVHMLTHSGQEKRFVCEVCGTSVNSQTYLKIHRRTHTGEKPYSCDVCGKSFNAHNYLKVHKRSHTGEKPYSCLQCGKCFTQRSTLVVHMRYHTGLRPYVCQFCSKSFATKTLLNSHEKNHT